jgi:hypothetical protein
MSFGSFDLTLFLEKKMCLEQRDYWLTASILALDRHGESKLVVSSDSSSQSLWFLICSPYAILVSRHGLANQGVFSLPFH